MQDHGAVVGVAAGLGVGVGVGAANGSLVTLLGAPLVPGDAGVDGRRRRARAHGDGSQIRRGGRRALHRHLRLGRRRSGAGLALWAIGAVAVGQFLFRHKRFGAHVVAVGDDLQAARVSGIRVDRVKFAVLVMSGTAAALAGILYTGRVQGASYTLGEQDLLTAIAAVVIGGTRLFGGEGSVIGALVGSLIMGMLTNGLILSGLSSSEQMVAQGLLLLLAICLTARAPRTAWG
jgi:ribose transport system permease protein